MKWDKQKKEWVRIPEKELTARIRAMYMYASLSMPGEEEGEEENGKEEAEVSGE